MRKISIRNWREPFTECGGIAVIFDIFRCSTTVQTLASHHAENLWVAKSLDPLKTQARNFLIFSELEDQLDCIRRFDNSPAAALYPEVTDAQEKPIVVATTSGTPALFAARKFAEVWLGALTNFSALVKALAEEQRNITLIPAAAPESDHVEDGIVAQELAIALDGFCLDKDFVQSCGRKCIDQIVASGRKEYLEHQLPTGIPDMRISLELDRYTFLTKINFDSGIRIPGMARVERCDIG